MSRRLDRTRFFCYPAVAISAFFDYIEMEGCSAMSQHGHVMQSFVMPVMFYCTPLAVGNSSSPQAAPHCDAAHVHPAPHDVPEETIERPHCDSDDEVYYHLDLAYNNPGQWLAVEDSLFIKATNLAILEQCYLEQNDGVYVPWGTVAADCEGVLTRFPLGLVHIGLEGMQAFILEKGKPAKRTWGLKVALRELRTYPTLIGFVCFEDGRKCFIEADRREGNMKESKHHLEDELLLAVIRCKQLQAQITFW